MILQTLEHIRGVIYLLTLALFLVSLNNVTDAIAQQPVCPPRAIEQITDGVDGVSQDAWIDGAGTRIAFSSRADLNGGNGNGNSEIFIFDTLTRIFTQITNEPEGDSLNPSISVDGMRVAFQSDADINGVNDGDNREVYLYDIPTGIITQVTDSTTGDSMVPVLNSNGTLIAFVSGADLTGMNADGSDEIFVFDAVGGTTTQITDSMEDSRNASINGDGTLIVFQSSANFTGGNPDGTQEIFLFDTTSGMFTQITNDPMEGSFDPAQ